MRSIAKIRALSIAALLAAGLAPAGGTEAAGLAEELPEMSWSFDGIFGQFDRAQLQRGLKVYVESCHTCHSLGHVAYRNLMDIGYDEDQVKDFAAQDQVEDGRDANGAIVMRTAVPSDPFAPPLTNAVAAEQIFGKVPPDLSLMAKAREGGPTYIYAILTGYDESGTNRYFPGGTIAMPQPLFGDTVDQDAKDVAAFLAWAAEPSLEHRKQLGLSVMLYMFALTVLFYAVKRKVWSKLK